MMIRAAIASIFVAMFGTLSPCSAQTGEPVAKPAVKPGDYWRYRQTDLLANRPKEEFELTVSFARGDMIHTTVYVEKRDSEASTRSISEPKPGQLDTDATFTSDWSPLAGADGSVWEINGAYLKFPLVVGATYRADFVLRRPREGAFRVRHERTVTVVGWEDVVVPAGKFRALKVEASGNYERLDTSGAGRTHWVVWYSPEVKRAVKASFQSFVPQPWEYTGTELVEFKVQ